MDYRTLLGLLSGAMAVVAYALYLKDIFTGSTKPHTFSWLIWALLAGIAFVGQVTGKAGAGEWVTGLTAAGCLLIFLVALFKGEKKILNIDAFLLVIAFVSIILLIVVKDKRISTSLATLALVIGSLLTTKKAYHRPHEETAKTFALNSAKFVPALLALKTYSYLTVVYPLAALITNGIIVGVIIVRRRSMVR